MIDTLSGVLMFLLATGIVALILLSVSRCADVAIPIDRALVAPAAACSLGAAVVNLWGSVVGSVPGAPPVVAAFLIGLFQAEWAFAVTRPHLRRSIVPAGIAIHGVAVVLGVASIVAALLAPGATTESVAATDLVAVGLEVAVLAMLAIVIRSRVVAPEAVRRIADRTAVEIRSIAVAAVVVLTFLAVAGPGHGHA